MPQFFIEFGGLFMRFIVCCSALLLMVVLSGCATVVKGSDQLVAVNTPGAEGAICELTSPSIGVHTVRTPGSINLPKSRKNISVVCKKECYGEATGVIESSLAAMTAGNIILGGGVGFIIDASSGAMNKYQPTITIPMTKRPGCRPKRADLWPSYMLALS